jgi:hypothetical protein
MSLLLKFITQSPLSATTGSKANRGKKGSILPGLANEDDLWVEQFTAKATIRFGLLYYVHFLLNLQWLPSEADSFVISPIGEKTKFLSFITL